MSKRSAQHFIKALCLSGVMLGSSQVFASAFQLWEQDATSVGNFHAGYAASAENASTAFYNPAGLTRFKNQQIVFAGAAVLPSVKYRGTVTVDTLIPPTRTVTAQGGHFAFVPALHFVSPINDVLSFGFSVTVPFGLSVDYGSDTVMKYAATKAGVNVIDLSPVLGIRLTDKASVGFGPDFQIMHGEFDQVGTFLGILDGDGVNKLHGTAWGYHAGWLYELSKNTRFGISYHSQVAHHLRGDSTFSGQYTDEILDGEIIESGRARLNLTLPPYTALSFFHHFENDFSVMASVIHTKWSKIKKLTLQNVAGVYNGEPASNIEITSPEYFRNTLSISLGGDYQLNSEIKLRAGVGFDQTPVRSEYRNVRLPDNDRYIIAFGGHYQASKILGFDAAWSHFFIKNAHINPPTQRAGDEDINTNGQVISGADVFALQVTWDIV